MSWLQVYNKQCIDNCRDIPIPIFFKYIYHWYLKNMIRCCLAFLVLFSASRANIIDYLKVSYLYWKIVSLTDNHHHKSKVVTMVTYITDVASVWSYKCQTNLFKKDSKSWISKDFMRFLNVSQYLVLYLMIRNIHIQSSFSYRCAQGGIT